MMRPSWSTIQGSATLVALSISTVFSTSGCSDGPTSSERSRTEQSTEVSISPEPGPAAPPVMAATSPEQRLRLLQPSHADWEEILESRVIRALVARSRTSFFLDGGRQRGFTADALYHLEQELNRKLGLRNRPLHIAAIPVARDRLVSYLEEGRGDIAIGDLTVTSDRRQRVEFSVPLRQSVAELVVTGPAGPALATLEDLAGERVRVRPSSSYEESLADLNASFREGGLPEIEIIPADEDLATEDLLEMVNAGLIRMTIADDYLARFWRQILTDLVVHEDLAVSGGREVAWAIRKSAPRLKELLDPFVREFRQGTLLGNTWHKRYLQDRAYLKNAQAQDDRQRFRGMLPLFRKYGDMYGLDPLLLAAVGYQESGLNQSVRSPVGAIGVMQVMPATAADPAVGIANIDELEPNIHAGAKYLRFVMDRYFADAALDEDDRVLFALASYNAGPNRIRRLRSEAGSAGRDPNQWFGHVELIVERRVGREPVRYVGNIHKYHLAYDLFERQEGDRERAIGGTAPDEGY